MHKVGIIGNGFVGSTVASGFALHANVHVYDIDPLRSVNTIEEVSNCDFIFVTVPTPMNVGDHNKIDLSIVESAFRQINDNRTNKTTPIVILKSTAIPGTTATLAAKYPQMEIVFNPEFLTERTARFDFINASRIVLGGSPAATECAAQLYRTRFPHTSIVCTSPESAEFIKYMCNCFFAMKISFMNEMKQAAEVMNLEWEDVLCGFLLDGRIGNSHVDVPGHDGVNGFGGKCFPKDLNAFINFFKSIEVSPVMLTATWAKNLEVRGAADWKKIAGATSTIKGE